jgi:hypothetical protein
MASNNYVPTLARVGDTITLQIVSGEQIPTPTVQIGPFCVSFFIDLFFS